MHDNFDPPRSNLNMKEPQNLNLSLGESLLQEPKTVVLQNEDGENVAFIENNGNNLLVSTVDGGLVEVDPDVEIDVEDVKPSAKFWAITAFIFLGNIFLSIHLYSGWLKKEVI